ncbi:hypothetical protein ACWC94_40625, partial [Streptomyces sp. NPDC001135]
MTSPAHLALSLGRRRACWHTGVVLAVLLGGLYLARRHWPALESGAWRLAGADRGWLLVGAAAAVGTWAASALAQQGAVVRRLPGPRLVAAQFAASAAGHLLPAGLGAGAVNLRFLMRCGLPAARSASALAVKVGAGAAVRLALIAVLAPACPGLLRLPRPSPGAGGGGGGGRGQRAGPPGGPGGGGGPAPGGRGAAPGRRGGGGGGGGAPG